MISVYYANEVLRHHIYLIISLKLQIGFIKLSGWVVASMQWWLFRDVRLVNWLKVSCVVIFMLLWAFMALALSCLCEAINSSTKLTASVWLPFQYLHTHTHTRCICAGICAHKHTCPYSFFHTSDSDIFLYLQAVVWSTVWGMWLSLT